MLSSTWEQTRRSFQGLGTFQVRGSEDATEADGQVKCPRDAFSLAVLPFPICVSKFGPNLCQYDRKHLFDAT